jgi:hypothetical protein
MNNEIAIQNELSHKELQEISDNTREYLKTSNNEVLEMITEKVNARPGLMGVLFPSKIQKEHEKLTIEQMKSLFKGRQDMLGAVLNLQLTLAQKMSEMIITRKVQEWGRDLSIQQMQIITELTMFSQLKLKDMKAVFDESRITFGERMAQLDADCEKYKAIEYLYNNYKKNLIHETDIFFSLIQKLYTGFNDALENKISEYKAKAA